MAEPFRGELLLLDVSHTGIVQGRDLVVRHLELHGRPPQSFHQISRQRDVLQYERDVFHPQPHSGNPACRRTFLRGLLPVQ